MTILRGPDDKDFDVLVAENRFISDLQMAIERALADGGHSQADFARMLNISEARVSHLLGGNGANLQARTIARIGYVLGKRAFLEFLDALDAKHSCERRAKPELDFQSWAKNIPNAREYDKRTLKLVLPDGDDKEAAPANDDSHEMAQIG